MVTAVQVFAKLVRPLDGVHRVPIGDDVLEQYLFLKLLVSEAFRLGLVKLKLCRKSN